MFTGTRVRHSLESLSQSPFSLLSSLRHYTKNAGSPTFYGFFVATRLCTASLLVATSFSCLFLMYLYTRISLKRAYFLLKRPRCSLTDARSAATNFYQRWQETMLLCAKCILDGKGETYEHWWLNNRIVCIWINDKNPISTINLYVLNNQLKLLIWLTLILSFKLYILYIYIHFLNYVNNINWRWFDLIINVQVDPLIVQL